MMADLKDYRMLMFQLICCLALLLGKVRAARSSSGARRAFVRDDNLLWTNGAVFYLFDDERFSEEIKDNVRQAIVALKDSLTEGCLDFIELSAPPPTPPYIRIIHSDCKSEIGMKESNATTIYLGQNCQSDEVVLHELLHSLGMVHEHGRPDRDFFVRINFTNIEEKYHNNFEIREFADRTFKTPFDYRSIMIYPKDAFAKDKNFDTITPVFHKYDQYMKYQNYLSPTDIVEISRAYRCPVKPEVKKRYSEHLEELFTLVLDKFTSCIDEHWEQDEGCQNFVPVTSYMLRESKQELSDTRYLIHKIHLQQSLDKMTLRQSINKNYKRKISNTETKISELKNNIRAGLLKMERELYKKDTIISTLRNKNLDQDNKIEELLRKNAEIKQELNTKDTHLKERTIVLRKMNTKMKKDLKKHSELVNNLLRYFNVDQEVFSKPWFGEPDVMVYGGHGYQLIEYEPFEEEMSCSSRFPGGHDASLNSQAELDVISELLEDRAALLGGWVKMTYANGRPSCDGFYWVDNSTTSFFHSLEKKFNVDKGVWYAPWMKAGQIYLGWKDVLNQRPELMVCEYP